MKEIKKTIELMRESLATLSNLIEERLAEEKQSFPNSPSGTLQISNDKSRIVAMHINSELRKEVLNREPVSLGEKYYKTSQVMKLNEDGWIVVELIEIEKPEKRES